jgi:hypothetical protein
VICFFFRCNAGLGSNLIKHRFISLGFIPDKNFLTGKARVHEFSKSGGAFLLLINAGEGGSYPAGLVFFSRCNAQARLLVYYKDRKELKNFSQSIWLEEQNVSRPIESNLESGQKRIIF